MKERLYTFVTQLSASCFACLILTLLCASDSNGQDDQAKTDFEPLKVLVAELESPEFSVREHATVQLVRCSDELIPIILDHIGHRDAEFQLRALRILKEFALKHGTTRSNAFQAIEKLSFSKPSRLSRIAGDISYDLRLMWQYSAAKRLERFNATVSYRAATADQRYPLAHELRIDSDWSGGVAELKNVADLFGLNSMFLEHPDVSDDIIQLTHRMVDLRTVRIRKCSVSGLSIAHLSKLNTISRLEILYCPIGSEGIEQLKQFDSLQNVRLVGTNVRPHKMAELSQFVFGSVDIREGAYLGIQYNPSVADCILTSVAYQSGAHTGGMKVGDQVVEFNGKEITEHVDLTKELRQLAAGAQARVKVIRDGGPLVMDVTLGEWK